MSIRIMAAVWDLPNLSSTQKLVLLSLADNANDDGVCWPSAKKTAARTGLNERSTRRAIAELEKAGILSRRFSPGKTTYYHIHPGRSDTPDTVPARTQSTQPRTVDTKTPDGRINITIKKPKETPKPFRAADAPQHTKQKGADLPLHETEPEKPNQGAGMVALPVDFLPDGNGGLVVAYRGDDERAQPQKPTNGHRLPDDWILPMAAGEWAMTEGLTRDQVLREAERFKDYWHSKPGKDALKTDWAGTWRNWIRKAADDLAKTSKRAQGPTGSFADHHADRSWADGLGFIEQHTDKTWRAGL